MGKWTDAAQAVKAAQAARDAKLANISTLMEGLGTVPTLTKFREFLAALRALLEEAV
jgi:hypothetical protein